MVVYPKYPGPELFSISDGNVISISHIGSSTVSLNYRLFELTKILCDIDSCQNLIFVREYRRANDVSIEFFPDYFEVKGICT